MPKDCQCFDSYEDNIMNYLTQIESESDDLLDMLSHKNAKFLFYQFRQQEIGKPLKLIRCTAIADDNYARTVIQVKKQLYFIECLLESFQATDEQAFLPDGTPQENAIVNDSIKNIRLCKNAYKNLYNAVADCSHQSFNYMDKRAPKKIDKDLRLNYFFIDFDYKHNAQDLMRAYAHFLMNQEDSQEV